MYESHNQQQDTPNFNFQIIYLPFVFQEKAGKRNFFSKSYVLRHFHFLEKKNWKTNQTKPTC